MAEIEKAGFVTQGDLVAVGEIPTVGIGMLGYAFMGKAHCNAFKKIPYIYWPPNAVPRLVRDRRQERGQGGPGRPALRLRAPLHRLA